MIDAVSTSSVQSSALRYTPQSATDSSTSIGASANPTNFVTSRVRVDNLQNVAILEYVSSNGQVVQQYPSQAQIQAFKRAEQLQSDHQQLQHAAAAHAAPAPTTHSSGSSSGSTYVAPAPQVSAPSTSTVATSSFNLNTASVVTESATLTAGSSQSILV